jgi:hypothetical protein
MDATMKTKNRLLTVLPSLIVLSSLFLAACSPAPTPIPATAVPTRTQTPLTPLTLTPGDYYFSYNGKPSFVFSRNLAGIKPDDFSVLLDMAHQQGNLIIRVLTDNQAMGGFSGYGYSYDGDLSEDWSYHWESLFKNAESKGVYIIPSFTGWANWNDTGFNTWASNPFNKNIGGPTEDPRDIYKKDSATQLLYLKWFRSVVTRWQTHKNILAWEVITEVNLINGISQSEGVYLTEQLAGIVRESDLLNRPVTASLADIGEWPNFYRSDAIDFINFHPYPPSARLDTYTLKEVRRYINTYNKPVLIGESGLNAETPDTAAGAISVAENARTGIEHAIWAQLVSGAMNGRALFWEDGYGIYIQNLGMPFLQKYNDVEVPAARFINGEDMTGFKPINANASGKILGAALGDETMIIGWYRDAGCEPPDWPLKQVISKQTVTLTIPGTATNWRVDFYDTHDGTTILGSLFLTRQGNTLIIPLPDFQDDIAFKAHS